MKKKILLPVFMMLFFIFFLVGCDKNDKQVETKKALKTPEIAAINTLVSWQGIENAVGYVVVINDGAQAQQSETYFELNTLPYGYYDVKVKAVAKRDSQYVSSELSNVVKVANFSEFLPEFDVINDEEARTLTWIRVKDANKYNVYANDELKATYTDVKETYTYSYADYEKLGDYTFKVVAESNKESCCSSTTSLKVDVKAKPLATPNISLNTNVVTWDENPNAKEYVIEVDNVEYRQTECYYPMPDTEKVHHIRVKAISNTETYLDSKFTSLIETKTSKNGYLDETTGDYQIYNNTSAYVKVTNAYELLTALKNARYDYTSTMTEVLENKGYVVRNNVRKNASNWTNAIKKGLYLKNADGTYTKIPENIPFDANDTTYTASLTYYEDSPASPVAFTQSVNKEGTVHVIEIMNDIDLGWNLLDSSIKNDKTLSISSFKTDSDSSYTKSEMYANSGMSQITISRCYDLLIFSKNGSKITHGGFKLESSKKVSIRNIAFDELWQWEDSNKTTTAKVGDMDAYAWAYFKINNCDEIWIDHCSFGKAYDGMIDISDPTFNTIGTLSRAPYEADGTCDVHISWCSFNEGSDDQNGYIYQMMQAVEADYQVGNDNYLYYKALRDAGYTFDEIFYGIAVPQKKAFLDGDANSGDYLEKIEPNSNLNLSIAYCKFVNIEDRLPKLRSGNAYIYGTIIDCTQYYDYLPALKSKTVANKTITAKSVVEKINSTWKCAGVSHGYMASMEGSIYVKDSIIKDVNSVICNNEDYAGPGGIIIENTRYVYRQNQIDFTGSIYDDNNPFISQKDGKIGPEYFHWNNETQSIPFYVEDIDVTTLESLLTICGTLDSSNPTLVSDFYLKNPYTI